MGKDGTIPVPSAIVSAIDDALWPKGGVHLREFPLVQEQVYQAAQQAQAEAKKGTNRCPIPFTLANTRRK